MTDNSMRNICRDKNGYVVRKESRGQRHERYFSTSRYGSLELALERAMTYRDELVDAVSSTPARHQRRRTSTTGIIGVTWTCVRHQKKPNRVENYFRARCVNGAGKERVKTIGIARRGVWNAYRAAAGHIQATMLEGRTRTSGPVSQPVLSDDHQSLTHAFLGFLTWYRRSLNDCDDPVLRKLLRQGIEVQLSDVTTPPDFLDALSLCLDLREPVLA